MEKPKVTTRMVKKIFIIVCTMIILISCKNQPNVAYIRMYNNINTDAWEIVFLPETVKTDEQAMTISFNRNCFNRKNELEGMYLVYKVEYFPSKISLGEIIEIANDSSEENLDKLIKDSRIEDFSIVYGPKLFW